MEEYEEQARLREDELMALEAILPTTHLDYSKESSSKTSSLQEVRLSVPAHLPNPTRVVINSHISSSVKDNEDKVKTRVEKTMLEGICHLPPINVLLGLPSGYPSHSAPMIGEISSDLFPLAGQNRTIAAPYYRQGKATVSSFSSCWQVKNVDWLRLALLRQWQDFQSEILFTWYEYLKEILWEDALDSSSSTDCPFAQGSPAVLIFDEYLVEESVSTSRQFESSLATSIRSYDILSKRKEFEGERFGCGICLEEKRGGKCWKVSACNHVFCQDCLTGYLSSMIREGNIRQASACPDPECVKARVIAENKEDTEQMNNDDLNTRSRSKLVGAISNEELHQFVGSELVARLIDLRERASASKDPSAGYCPRPGCEKLVRGDPKDIGTMYESMRMCECGFTYCLYCNKAWHGKAPCNLVSSTALIERYQQAAEGSSTRKEMEQRYGKANLEKMIRNYEEETQNKAYIESNTQKCPCCSVRIEKSMGCNHMTCRSCHTHLCYRCGTRLNPREPYRHFNTPGTNCFQKLFDVDVGTGGGHQDDWRMLDVGAEEDLAQWEAEL